MPIMLEQRPTLTGKASGTVTNSDVDVCAVNCTRYLDSGETMTGTPVITEEGILIGTGTVGTTANTLDVPNHSLVVGDVIWTQTSIGKLRQGHHYHVLTVSGNLITLGETAGGTTVEVGTGGKAEIWKYGTAHLTLAGKVVSSAVLVIEGETVAIGNAIQWSVTGQQAGYVYAVRVSCGTTASRTKVFLASFTSV